MIPAYNHFAKNYPEYFELHTSIYLVPHFSLTTSFGAQRVFVTSSQNSTVVVIISSSGTSLFLVIITVSHMSTYVVLHEDRILAHTLTITPFSDSCSSQ